MLPRPVLAVLLLLVSSNLLKAAETPIPPSPTEWVTDTANFMSPSAVASLNARLSAYQQSTGHQLIVYIGSTTGDDPIDDWAVRAFKQWKVGRKGLDDGLALFIMSQDHKIRIEVGYGLEAIVPDVTAFRVIDEVIAPRIKDGHPDDAVTAGIDALIAAIGGQAAANPPAQAPAQAQPQPISLIEWIFIGIGGILLLILLITHPGLAFFLLANILSGGGGGGGGGSGGGGFSGGGGRSGGGGASGSW